MKLAGLKTNLVSDELGAVGGGSSGPPSKPEFTADSTQVTADETDRTADES